MHNTCCGGSGASVRILQETNKILTHKECENLCNNDPLCTAFSTNKNLNLVEKGENCILYHGDILGRIIPTKCDRDGNSKESSDRDGNSRESRCYLKLQGTCLMF